MTDLIVIAGSPGSGKSTVCEILRAKLSSPYIEFSSLREFHLDREWTTQNPQEEAMAFENLIYIVKNYIRHGWKNVIVTDLKDFRVEQIPEVFGELDFVIATLVADSDDEIAHRIRTRNSGWTNVEGAIEWNRHVRGRDAVVGEHKIDNSHGDPRAAVDAIMRLLDDREAVHSARIRGQSRA